MFAFVKFCSIGFEVFVKYWLKNEISKKRICLFFSHRPQNWTYRALLTYTLDDERCGGKICYKTLLVQWKKKLKVQEIEISYCGENVHNYMKICENREH